MHVYHVKPGGAVLASLERRDPEYERRLERSGIEFEVTEMAEKDAPSAEVLPRAAVRDVEVEVTKAGKKVKEIQRQLQIDREGTVH